MRPGLVMVVLWVAWAASWVLAAGWSNATEKTAGVRAQLGYRALMILGCILFGIPAHGYEGRLRLWHIGWLGAWIAVLLMLLGFAFAWWARLHLGRLWSGQITKKAEHRIVDTGPYRWVRHPIYTGLLLAIGATLWAKGTWLGLLGAALLTSGMVWKARLEERWLRAELGPERYDEYRRRTPMLLPFGPKGS